MVGRGARLTAQKVAAAYAHLAVVLVVVVVVVVVLSEGGALLLPPPDRARTTAPLLVPCDVARLTLALLALW